jgi:cyclopropane fatty-acyl-phospholipid synthase-like methyltransferase
MEKDQKNMTITNNRFKYDRQQYVLECMPSDNIDRLTLERMQSNKQVLELGCATGYMTRYLSEELSCKVTAVDLSKKAIQYASAFAKNIIVGDLNSVELWKQIVHKGPYDSV